jgi:salicylate synthase
VTIIAAKHTTEEVASSKKSVAKEIGRQSYRFHHYLETRVPTGGDPLLVTGRLARSGLDASYVVLERFGTWRYAAGVRAQITLDRRGAILRQENEPEVFLPWSREPLKLVSELLDRISVPAWRAYGWAAFELSYAKYSNLEHLGADRLLHLIVPRAEAIVSADHVDLRAADEVILMQMLDALGSEGPGVSPPRPLDVRVSSDRQYCEAVRAAIAEIDSGQLQKVILSRIVEVDEDIDLVATYLTGRQANRPARSFLLNLGDIEAAGFSPEIVLSVAPEGRVTSQPLAGTRALVADPRQNEVLRADLLSSPKEIYEHAISVKTGTDELAEVCEPGTVAVPEFMAIRERGSVQHLASQVSGQLTSGRDAWDAFAAVFPAVTASGVPKEAAYAAIRRHESGPRGLYSGAVMTIDQTGEMDAALVLRSAFRKDGRTWLQAGAGIVGQSDPERELEETCEKLDSVARYLVPRDKGGLR